MKKKYTLTPIQEKELYKSLLVWSDQAIKRHNLYHLEPEDLANDIWIQFITQKKLSLYDPKRGANLLTFSRAVCSNLLKNHLTRKSKKKDDLKRLVLDTFNEKTQQYFYDLAKQYEIDSSDDDDNH